MPEEHHRYGEAARALCREVVRRATSFAATPAMLMTTFTDPN
jgi:hypothetical protein